MNKVLRPIEVTLERDGTVVDRIDRLPRRMPDGSIGVEYMGLVYPLARAGRAAMDGRWCYPSEAPICLEAPELSIGTGRTFWTLDRSGTRPYLFVNGSEALLAETLSRLASAAVAVEHHGPSFREGESGLLHDWFVRLDPTDAPGDWELAQLLADVAEPDVPPDAATPELVNARLRRDHDRLATRLVNAERELATAIAAADANQAELDGARYEAERASRRLETEAAFLRAGISALRSQTPVVDDGLVADLNERVDVLTADRDDALASWTKAEESVTQLRIGLEAAEAALAEASARPNERPAPATRKQARADAELQTVLRTLLPGIDLVRGSADFILTEVEDRRDLYGKLRLLIDDPVSVGGKRVHAADGWLEVHMGTGRGRDGRLYYKKSGLRWSVLVSDKAAQPNDFQWLKAQ
ncbi:hypothetical protein [Sphingomonas corticis]|uniref:Uncharacterized protein n=1 Tax=Sphingomonas corticis TaxID=2722791 RepID=A0ABX1CHM9_9SPHN|nr:hypothetical protein [Sphingomonas corticis]NJR77519.1 hypothetical protein [Sphingomonas corticis]